MHEVDEFQERQTVTYYRTRGFTLIELMVVIAIMAIMAAIAAPNFKSFMAQRRLNGAARQVMSDLMAARMKAVTINQKVKVSFTGNHAYEIWNDANSNGTVADNEGDDVAKDIQVDYHDVTFSSTANPVFDPRGTAAALATVTLTNSAGSKTVSVAITGRVVISG
ncbi:MAG: GspH/FimT family pseudopilin [Syntrophus sp. (in: bacteria)]|nr:GspH/FimT family pseudopilin [Syntrophus sp. (in: bacteria)]